MQITVNEELKAYIDPLTPDEHAALTRGFYETARFLLRNNKKTEPVKGAR